MKGVYIRQQNWLVMIRQKKQLAGDGLIREHELKTQGPVKFIGQEKHG